MRKGTYPVPNQSLPSSQVPSSQEGPPSAVTARSALASRFVELVADKLVATEAVFRHHLASDVPFIHKTGEYIF
jgi:hypothetical protein